MSTNTTLHTPRILLLEENPLFRTMTQAMLEILGVKCLSTHLPEEALEIFQKGCDLVLLDVNVANTKNLELAKQMRLIDASTDKHTPLIGNTEDTDLDQIEALSLDAQIDCTYPKIHNLQELSFILAEWLTCAFGIPENLKNMA